MIPNHQMHINVLRAFDGFDIKSKRVSFILCAIASKNDESRKLIQ
jgi:hypothetical protein